jgi:hypothetical protein
MLTRQVIVEKLQGTLLASDTDSVTFAIASHINTAEEVVGQVNILNKLIAEHLNTHFMTLAIEEIILPSK